MGMGTQHEVQKEIRMIKAILIACLATIVLAEVEAEADPYYGHGYSFGWPYYGYGGQWGHRSYGGWSNYGKRSADAESTAKADADPYYGYGYRFGYHGYPYYGYGGNFRGNYRGYGWW